MRVVDRLSVETEAFHANADEDVFVLLGPVTPADYRHFLARMYGFVAPLERSLASVEGLDAVLDPRRFRKSEMLRFDLLASRFTTDAIDALPQCTVPPLTTVEEALAWAFPIERSALGHTNLYRHLATKLPGDIAFASAYLKCYSGIVGESWKSFADALDRVVDSDLKAQLVFDCARAAFRTWRAWRVARDEQLVAISDGGIREQEPA